MRELQGKGEKMKRVLYLGPSQPTLDVLLESESVFWTENRVVSTEGLEEFDYIVSHGYRYKLPPSVIAMFGQRAINCHISMLPWNRGADPNLWSWVDDTPKGVSIHVMDVEFDTGLLLFQEEVVMRREEETLRTSYEKLQNAMTGLFRRWWPQYKKGWAGGRRQMGDGTSHRAIEKEGIMLRKGWDTPCAELKRENIFPVEDSILSVFRS